MGFRGLAEHLTVILVEKDAELARFLTAEGHAVTTDPSLDGLTAAYLDVWTAETDDHVRALRARGVPTTCLADLVLERWPHTIGVTGTAGKSTTTWLIRQLVGGRSSRARADNLWPTAELLDAARDELLVLELTSSHLAFCHHSPRVAVVTTFWPDHLELHGGLAEYRAAKARMFQRAQVAVLPRDDTQAAALADGSSARRVWYGEGSDVYCAGRHVVVGDRSWPLEGFPEALREGGGLRSLLAALAAAGPVKEVGSLELPPHRRKVYGRVTDDTLAATPRKAAAGLVPGTALVAGGMRAVAGRVVHSYPEEQPALEEWVGLIRERCASVDLFGDAGEWLHERVGGTLHRGVLEALEAALERGDSPVLVAPGFPMTQEDRERVRTRVG